MSVFKRKTTSGETSEYHYRFMKGGKLFFGVCQGCFEEATAKKFEADLKSKVSQLENQKTVKAIVENFRDELSCGDKILLKDTFAAIAKKPRQRTMSEKQRANKESRFNDFIDFMAAKYPDVKYINDVTSAHAEEYIAHLRTEGRFNKAVESSQGNYISNNTQLSSATVNRFLDELKSTFASLMKQTGMLENPFEDIEPVLKTYETREAFTEHELELILKTAPPFIRSIFIVGFFTALREGDISTLQWSDVLWEHGVIRRKMLKTGVVVEIPIMPPLAEFLKEQIGKDKTFVLPEHAEMYLKNPFGISYRVKKFLEDDLSIQTTKKVPGRSRAVSIKDVHSLRHTFCYFAGVAGIPLVVVQSIVGHMTPEMTAHYTAHTDRKTKREKLAALPIFKALSNGVERNVMIEQKRLQVIEAIKKADSDTLNRIAAMLLPVKVKKSLLHNTEPET